MGRKRWRERVNPGGQPGRASSWGWVGLGDALSQDTGTRSEVLARHPLRLPARNTGGVWDLQVWAQRKALGLGSSSCPAPARGWGVSWAQCQRWTRLPCRAQTSFPAYINYDRTNNGVLKMHVST